MREGWKEQIKLSVGYDPWYWDIEDAYSEIDRVYEQAALKKEKIKQIEETYKVRYSEHIELKRKSDEYEAKAKAFDAILKSYDESYSNSHLGDEVIGIIQKYAESRSDSDER